ncbi:MAG: NAD(P)/FAD-dependent oxidoreductase [Synechococcales bacterium]|nr:NAD(P)/FAD-dependent oxidoreductase [Synechococcales bacterium]
MQSPKPRVVIAGAGFAGIEAAKTLSKSGLDVVLIDRNNYHTFIPMLYQVATATVDPQQVVYPIRRFFRRSLAVHFLNTEVKSVDFEGQRLHTADVSLDYDYLILATGSQSQYLGIPGAPKHALPMRSLAEAIAIRNHVLRCCEQAAKTTDEAERRRLLTFVIVGGGPTGVELAGALAELLPGLLQRDYATLDASLIQIFLLQSGEQLLKSYPKRLGDYTARWLRRHGVRVHLATRVSQVTPTAVHLGEETTIPTHTVIWTAGVKGAPPKIHQPVETVAGNKIFVTPTLQVAGRSQVYAVGDLAKVDGESLTGVAQEAIQQGRAAAQNILRQVRGQVPQPFEYRNKGRLAIIGRHAGVGEIGRFAFTGFLAWFLWLEVHLFYLPGVRNRLGVLFNWLKAYFFGEGTSRLIITPADRPVTEVTHQDTAC